MERCDFLIIGAGMAGASAAYFLRRHGSVAVLEAESQPGYHTTGRSAAFYAPSYGNEFIRPLTLASGPFLHNPPDGFTDAPLLHKRGALYVAREDQLDALQAFHGYLSETGAQTEQIGRDEALKRCSALRSDYVAAALYEETCYDIDVDALHQAYLRGMAQNGRVICDAPAQTIRRVGSDWQVETPVGDFAASVLVNAAGAWADEIAKLAGAAPVGLTPLRRTIVILPAPETFNPDWPLTLDVDDQFYFKPEAGAVLASPGDETPSPACDAQPEELDIATAVDRLQTATTISAPRIQARWAGLRTFAPDRTPVAGFDPDLPGFFWLAGQGGYGIKTSPALGQMSADLITRGALLDPSVADKVDPAQYTPARFHLEAAS